MNAIFLFINWDSFSGIAVSKERQPILAGEELVLEGEDADVTRSSQPEPDAYQPPASRLTRIISKGLEFVAELWQGARNILFDRPENLPGTDEPAPQQEEKEQTKEIEETGETKEKAAKSPPPKKDPTTEEDLPPKSIVRTTCYKLEGYANSEQAQDDKALLESYGIEALLRGVTDRDSGSFRIWARARVDLDRAKELSDILASSGIPNRIEESSGVGFVLVTRAYSPKKAAERTNAKMKDLGFSTEMRRVGKDRRYYHLLIRADAALSWEHARERVLKTLKPGIKVSTLVSCR